MYELCKLSTIKGLLSKYGFTFSKELGQNFLIDSSVPLRIAQMCDVDSNSGVIEIGPGIGCLTSELCQVAKKVVAIELDKRLLPILSDTLQEFNNVSVVNKDILKVDLHSLIKQDFQDMDLIFV